MKKNFTVTSPISIQIGKAHVDLHNDFEFHQLVFDLSERKCLLIWSDEKNDASVARDHLRITFHNVKIFSVRERQPEYPLKEDQNLSFVGYLHPDDLSIMNGFLPEENSSNNFHMIFGFESGFSIKLYADEVTAELSVKEGGFKSEAQH